MPLSSLQLLQAISASTKDWYFSFSTETVELQHPEINKKAVSPIVADAALVIGRRSEQKDSIWDSFHFQW